MATASSARHENLDLTNCSICLEHFKSPRYLPCAHTFCHSCLSTHIRSLCASKDDLPLGFPCPICRKFVPAPGRVGQLSHDKWADCFPENLFLAPFAEKYDRMSQIPCTPCTRGGEEKKANSWCRECTEALCDDCFNSHKKFKWSTHHEKISLSEISAALTPFHDFVTENCEIHDGRKIVIFCESHFAPCCVLCATKEHGSCQALCPIEEVAENLLKQDMVKCLKDDIDRFDSLLETVIKEKKVNVTEIDDVAEKITSDISETKDAVIETVKRLEEKHLNEVAKLSKDAKAKLEKYIDALEQRRCYLRHWKEATSKNLMSKESSKSMFALSYAKLEQVFKDLRKLEISKLEIEMRSTMHNNIRELIVLPCLAEITLTERKSLIVLNETNIKVAKIQMVSEFKIDGADFRGGVYLRNNELVLADFSKRRLIRCTADGVVLKEVSLQHSPWDVSLYKENQMYVTLPSVKTILLMRTDSLNTVKSINYDSNCHGMSQSDNTVALGCVETMEVLDMDFRKIKSSRDLSRVYDVAVDMEENIIYSSFSDHIIRKEDRKGNVLFTYNHEELKKPYGLTVDRIGNIYVNGKESNNIHILSPSGEKIRILEGVKCPQCIKIQENSNRFFVGEASGRVKIFQYIE